MLTEQDFAAWVARTRLSVAAQAAMEHIRRSGPSRRVGGGRSNVTGRYPSKKMGVTIQFERHRVELPVIFELEHDCSVLEYYDQVLDAAAGQLGQACRLILDDDIPDILPPHHIRRSR
jgi:hypothetical protein